jgi:hypothetical protein
MHKFAVMIDMHHLLADADTGHDPIREGRRTCPNNPQTAQGSDEMAHLFPPSFLSMAADLLKLRGKGRRVSRKFNISPQHRPLLWRGGGGKAQP